MWKAQFLPTVRGAQYTGILDGTVGELPKTLEVAKAEEGTCAKPHV